MFDVKDIVAELDAVCVDNKTIAAGTLAASVTL